MELQVHGKGANVTVSDQIFACEYSEGLVHQVVTAYLAGGRQGTKAQKTRSDVSGGGTKPWRQKGTGRARAGTIRSPIWRSGGKSFAARPRDFKQKLNKKMYKRAMRVILSELARNERLVVADDFALTAPKTKELAAKLQKMQLNDALIITAAADDNIRLSARNIPNVTVLEAMRINPVDLIAYEKVVVTADALKKIEEKLA
ncbi:MAG: 50S ribosomal protein L4 [Gammaproteobacteria bacterium]|nr:50S ribosomal protein L4 [Gammaproteobacteria bacterium]MCH9744875.1 50S ribosomal protein L4 [Gammaproteobacteria bacterium]